MTLLRKRLLILLGGFFLIAGLLYGVYWLFWGRFLINTEDAYVNGNQVELMAQISGTVITIFADDTQRVIEGQPLIRMDETDKLVALQKARANLAETVRQVKQYYEQVPELRATLAIRKATLLEANSDLKRRTGLVPSGALSKEELTQYTTREKAAASQYKETAHQLAAAIAIVQHSTLYQHPIVEQAKNNFRRAYLDWVRTMVYAPVTGYIAKREVQVGQQINTGVPLLAIIPLDQIWVDANYKENQLDRIRIGQPVTLKADVNGVTYHGRVVGFNPGTGNAFAILPPQNASGNWIKIVQRLAVRIALKPKEVRKYPLQLGLSMNVTIHTRKLKGARLSTINFSRPLYSTWIFDYQLRDANQEIDAILHANAKDMKYDG